MNSRRLSLDTCPSLLLFQDLCELSGYKRRADVERWAKETGIAVKPCRGGVWTTLEAVNVALGVAAANDSAAPYDPDLI